MLLRVHLDETTKQVVPYAMENVTPEIHHTIRTFSAYDIPPLDNPVYVLKAYAERPGSGRATVFRSTEASCRQSPSRSRRPKNEDLTFSSDPRVKRIAPESYSEVFSMPHHQPAGYPTVSVYMMVDGAQRMIDFVTDVLDGEVIMRIDRDDSSLMHGSLRIGDSVIMLADATKDFPTFPVWLHVYVPDVDATYRRALEKGATSVQEPSEKGDGDRRAGVKDPAGNTWWIATHVGR